MMQKFIFQGPTQFATDFCKEFRINEKCFQNLQIKFSVNMQNSE